MINDPIVVAFNKLFSFFLIFNTLPLFQIKAQNQSFCHVFCTRDMIVLDVLF